MAKGDDAVSQIIGQHLTGVAARYLNQRSDNNADLFYSDNFRALAEMAQSRFEWINLPETVSSAYIEKTLFYKGCVVFFRDRPTRTNAYFALQGHGTGMLNMYDEHIRYQITAPNFRGAEYSLLSSDCVPIWTNTSRVPDALRAAMYAEKLTQLDVTFDINAMQTRRTRTLIADENSSMTANAINDSIDRGDPVIKLRRGLEKDNFDVIDFGVEPKNLIDLHIAKQRVWADAMTRLGVDNANQDKKERLVADEVEANDAQVGAMRQSPLEQRREAVRLINERYKFSPPIEVRYREMTTDVGTLSSDTKETENSDNGTVHA